MQPLAHAEISTSWRPWPRISGRPAAEGAEPPAPPSPPYIYLQCLQIIQSMQSSPSNKRLSPARVDVPWAIRAGAAAPATHAATSSSAARALAAAAALWCPVAAGPCGSTPATTLVSSGLCSRPGILVTERSDRGLPIHGSAALLRHVPQRRCLRQILGHLTLDLGQLDPQLACYPDHGRAQLPPTVGICWMQPAACWHALMARPRLANQAGHQFSAFLLGMVGLGRSRRSLFSTDSQAPHLVFHVTKCWRIQRDSGFSMVASRSANRRGRRTTRRLRETTAVQNRPPGSRLRRHHGAAFDGLDIGIVRSAATAADTGRRTVTTTDGREFGYDALIIATGAGARRLATPGRRGELVLRTLDDARLLRSRLETAASAIVVGAGFLGMEVASACAARGIPVSVVDVDRPLERILGGYLSAAITEHAESYGIRCVSASGFAALAGDPVHGVALPGDGELTADLVVTCAGETPSTDWPAGTGLADQLGVGIDHTCATLEPGVYAAGDLTYLRADETGPDRRAPFWSNALAQGRSPQPPLSTFRPRHRRTTTTSGPRLPGSLSKSSAPCRPWVNPPPWRAAWRRDAPCSPGNTPRAVRRWSRTGCPSRSRHSERRPVFTSDVPAARP